MSEETPKHLWVAQFVWEPRAVKPGEPDVVTLGAMSVIADEMDRIERSPYRESKRAVEVLSILGQAFKSLAYPATEPEHLLRREREGDDAEL